MNDGKRLRTPGVTDLEVGTGAIEGSLLSFPIDSSVSVHLRT